MAGQLGTCGFNVTWHGVHGNIGLKWNSLLPVTCDQEDAQEGDEAPEGRKRDKGGRERRPRGRGRDSFHHRREGQVKGRLWRKRHCRAHGELVADTSGIITGPTHSALPIGCNQNKFDSLGRDCQGSSTSTQPVFSEP